MLRAIPVDDVRRENILAAHVEAGPRWTGLCARFREALRLCAAPPRVQFRLPVIRSDIDCGHCCPSFRRIHRRAPLPPPGWLGGRRTPACGPHAEALGAEPPA